MNAPSEALDDRTAHEAVFDFDTVFRAHYAHITRVIARVVKDRARAEELAVEVFVKLHRNRNAQGDRCLGWLRRAAVRVSLNELRGQARRARYEKLFGFERVVQTPEEAHTASEEQQRVRAVLAALDKRHAALLLLRSEDLSYSELAAALDIHPASVGTLLSRAQQAFRKEFVKRYGEQ